MKREEKFRLSNGRIVNFEDLRKLPNGEVADLSAMREGAPKIFDPDQRRWLDAGDLTRRTADFQPLAKKELARLVETGALKPL